MLPKKYDLLLYTAPSVEPLTLNEVKDYLKISDFSSCNGILSNESINQEVRNIGTVNGNYIDVSGYNATIQLIVGSLSSGGKLDIKIQESNDHITWTDYYSFTQIAESTDNETYLYDYQGSCRYIRIVGVLTVAGGNYSANILLNLGYTEEDIYLNALIKTAREYCEKEQCRAFITQTWEMSFDYWPEEDVIDIPLGNLQTIDSVKYYDSDNVEHTLVENTNFIKSTRGLNGKIVPCYSTTWPTFTPRPIDQIIIRFTCGYGDLASDVPESVKLAMKLLISHWFENRIPIDKTLSNVKPVEFSLNNLLINNKIWIL